MVKSEFENDKDKDVFSGIGDLLSGKTTIAHVVQGLVPLKKAPNAVIFIESKEFLEGPRLHDPQYEIVRDFFELLCPVCNDIARIHSVNDVPRENQILFEYDVCPKCKFEKNLHADDFSYYDELIGVVGMRGGKSVLIAAIAANVLHEVLCVDELQKNLGLVRDQDVEGAFVAASGEQVQETVYGNFKSLYDNSPWFQNYKKALLDLEVSQSGYHKGSLYWETNKGIFFKCKNIRIKSLHSNSGSITGKTRIFTVIDELSRMEEGVSKRSVTEVYRAFKRSLMTIKASVDKRRLLGKYDIPDARMFCISSPIHRDDKAMQLLKQAEKSQKMFAFHRATWEFNPTITREDLAEEYALDPLGAERDYGANPPGAENPLISNPGVIDACIDWDRPSIFTLKEVMFDQDVRGVIFNYLRVDLLDVKYKNLNDYVIHCDPGEKRDGYCLAIGHAEQDVVIIDGAIDVRPVARGKYSGIQRDVFFPSMTDIILSLNDKLSLKFLSYDRWNSTEQIHKLRSKNVLAFGKNLTRDDHIRFVNSMMQDKVRFPRPEDDLDPIINRNRPCNRAIYELRRLNDTGAKVDHQTGGTNDMIQCYVGVYRLLCNPEQVISKEDLAKQRMHQGLVNRKSSGVGRIVKLPQKRNF